MFAAIISWDQIGRVTKHQLFADEATAIGHIEKYGGFVSPDLGGDFNTWRVVEGLLTFDLPDPTRSKVTAITSEAERRIEAGTLVGGNLIRCDDRSVSRLHGMLKKSERLEAQSKPVSLKFKTQAGAAVTITSAAEAGAVYDAISDHVSFMLARSADLQDAVATMTPTQLADFNPSDETHWTE
jgi:hypothetical protein